VIAEHKASSIAPAVSVSPVAPVSDIRVRGPAGRFTRASIDTNVVPSYGNKPGEASGSASGGMPER